MEQAEQLEPVFSFKRFLLRSWLTNLAFTLTFALIAFWCFREYTATTATRVNFLTNLVALPIAWTHSLLLLIFAVRRLTKKHFLAGTCFFIQFLLSSVIGYYLYVYLALFGWAYAMKGH